RRVGPPTLQYFWSSSMPRWKPRWKTVLIVIVVLIILIVGWRALQGGGGKRPGAAAQGDKQPPVPVTVVPVVRKDVPTYLNATGTVQALRTVTVQPQVGGRLLSIDFEEGQEVDKGQVLARIDPRTYKAT